MNRFRNKGQLRGLIITSKEGEQIHINGGEVKIELVQVRGRAVRLAFQASSDIAIKRVPKQLADLPTPAVKLSEL